MIFPQHHTLLPPLMPLLLSPRTIPIKKNLVWVVSKIPEQRILKNEVLFREIRAILRNFIANDCRIKQNDSGVFERVWRQRSKTVVCFAFQGLVTEIWTKQEILYSW